jgi:hypothetical protein
MVSGYISTFCSGAVSETSLLFPASEHFLQEAGVDPDSRKGVKEYPGLHSGRSLAGRTARDKWDKLPRIVPAVR